MRERLYYSWSSISPKQIVSYRLSIVFLHLSFFEKFKNPLILGFHIKYLWGWNLQGKTSVKSLTTQRFNKSLPYWFLAAVHLIYFWVVRGDYRQRVDISMTTMSLTVTAFSALCPNIIRQRYKVLKGKNLPRAADEKEMVSLLPISKLCLAILPRNLKYW